MLVNITIPVFNEEKILPSSIGTLHQFLGQHCRFDWEIVIANNASTDATLARAQDLAQRYPGVRVFHLDQKGRGRALKSVWTESSADIFSYMDVAIKGSL